MKTQEEKSLPIVKSLFIYFLFLLLISMTLLSRHLIQSTKYEGVVLENGEIMVMVTTKELKLFDEQNKLKINGREYDYEVERIEKEIVSLGPSYYKKIILKIPDYKSSKFANFVFEFLLEGKPKTILEIIRDFWKGE